MGIDGDGVERLELYEVGDGTVVEELVEVVVVKEGIGVVEARELVSSDLVVAGELCLLNIKAGECCLATGGGSAIRTRGGSFCKRGGKSSGPI